MDNLDMPCKERWLVKEFLVRSLDNHLDPQDVDLLLDLLEDHKMENQDKIPVIHLQGLKVSQMPTQKLLLLTRSTTENSKIRELCYYHQFLPTGIFLKLCCH